ncbi:MAG TPA: tetratricopeptide repeat protein [Syntrophales bacterium]|nr:tetratricopeptide repeat protein [Syntrophales bacterium]
MSGAATLAADSKPEGADRQFSFAESLFAEGDYYRAVTEYKRFIFFFPENKLSERCAYRIGESYYMAKRWQESRDAFTSFISRYPLSPMVIGALYMKGMSEKELKLYNEALMSFDQIIKSKNNEFSDKAIYQSALILTELQNWKKARETFASVPKDSPYSERAGAIASGISRLDDLPEKSPTVAGTLAAILPGAGHLYTERPRDALVSFLLNGAFIVGAVELFRHENYVAGGIVTFFEVGWYTGNIYSAVNSAHKYNQKVRDDFITHLKEIGSISFHHDPSTASNSIIFSFNY